MHGQWIALDMYFFAKPFPLRLRERFGVTGQMVFIAFLCACKQNWPQGEITFCSDHEALQKMRIEQWQLVDDGGEKWSLDEFWTFTGRMKQTRRTSRGRVWNVKSTQFERWQRTTGRDLAAERQRRSRAKKRRDSHRDIDCDSSVTDTVTDKDNDKDISPYPRDASAGDDTTSDGRRGNGHQKPRDQKTNPRATGSNPRALNANPRAQPETDPLVQWVRTCIPGTGVSAAAMTVGRLRHAGIGDLVIEEAAGYAAEHGGHSARYVEQVAYDWMAQRDPTWNPEPPS